MSYQEYADSNCIVWICDECGHRSQDTLNWEVNYKEGTDTCSMCVRERIERHIKEAKERKAATRKSWLFDLI